jgi:hypothetical protein
MFINQIPMTAAVSEVECVVRVFATMTMYNQENHALVFSDQVVFVWKPVYPGNTAADCTCNLELLRVELRNPQCNFNEPICIPGL